MATTYKYLFLKIFYVIVICLEFGALTASLMLCQLIFKMFARYFINLDTVLNIVQFEYVIILSVYLVVCKNIKYDTLTSGTF